jgi:hypothetical protein
VLAGKRLVDIDPGYQATCALDSDGKAYCWGQGIGARPTLPCRSPSSTAPCPPAPGSPRSGSVPALPARRRPTAARTAGGTAATDGSATVSVAARRPPRCPCRRCRRCLRRRPGSPFQEFGVPPLWRGRRRRIRVAPVW